jgi:hypothetical protein
MSTKKVHGNTGRIATEEAKQAMREGWEKWREDGNTKKPFTRTHRRRLSEAGQGDKNSMSGKNHTEESKALIGDKIRGRKQTEAEKKKRGDANKGMVREKIHCQWCDDDVAVNGYARFHGDNCHMNPDSPRYDPNKKIRKPKS